MKKLVSIVGLLALLGFAGINAVNGSPIVLSNPSFETPSTLPNSYSILAAGGSPASISGWDFANASPTGSVGGLAQMGGLTGGDGAQYAFFNTTIGTGAATITYNGSLPTIAATTYTLTVAIANNTAVSAAGPATLDLELTANGAVLSYATTTVLQSSIASGTFVDFTVNLSAADIAAHSLAGEALGITLVTEEAPSGAFNNFNQGAFDNVRLSDSNVPEPSTWALVGVGALALVWQANRKRLI
jgi:hypothetical protein